MQATHDKIIKTAQRVLEIEANEILKLSQRLSDDFAKAFIILT